ncbi:MAG: hypothetical protein PHD82_14700 [Candidatus Riflebacteria bacterium]|nr:hypothetical protein [Candidatus Riflebacteria bacterium]
MDALSLEAQAAIEAMRERLNAAAMQQPVVAAVVDAYVPGQQLASAMSRLRQQLYGIDSGSVELAMVEPVSKKQVDTTDYKAGQMLLAALIKIRHSQGRTESLRVAMADIDSVIEPVETASEKPVEVAQTIETPVPAPEEPAVVAPVAQEKPAEKIEKNTKKAPAKKHKKKKSGKSYKNQEIAKKAAPAAKKDKQVKVASEKSHSSSGDLKIENASSKGEDDKQFNEFIKKYDFKMPENYRIIVR